MKKPSLRLSLHLGIALLTCATGMHAQSLHALTAKEAESAIKRSDLSQLPEHATDVRFDRKQAVTFTGTQPLTLLPVRYAAPNPGGGSSPFFQCGFFLLSPGAQSKFVVTFGADFTETESCTSLIAIGTAQRLLAPGSFPSVAVIYSASTTRETFAEPILLRYENGTYVVDAELSQWLGQQKTGHTVPGIRSLLASRALPRKTNPATRNMPQP